MKFSQIFTKRPLIISFVQIDLVCRSRPFIKEKKIRDALFKRREDLDLDLPSSHFMIVVI
jgi:hypothetical protein